MFNLNETKHDIGVFIRDDGSVMVALWMPDCEDNTAPVSMNRMCNMPMDYEFDDTVTLVKEKDVADVRNELPGRVWLNDDGEVETDMRIEFDYMNDLPEMFGIRVDEDGVAYRRKDIADDSYPGTVYRFDGTGYKLITVDGKGFRTE